MLLILLEHPKIKPLVIFAAFFIFLNTLLFYGFVRNGTWLVIAILLVPVYRQIGLLNFLLSAFSFLFGTVVSIFILEYGFPQLTYWPPFDRLKSTDENGLICYKPNQNITVQLPYGQLKPWSRKMKFLICVPEWYRLKQIQWVSETVQITTMKNLFSRVIQ